MAMYQCPRCYTPFSDSDLEDDHFFCPSCSLYINKTLVRMYYKPVGEDENLSNETGDDILPVLRVRGD